tara:strand:- start:414 stop:629 length:216 start_codon:yes stop_codon:yes gene_type:complete
MWFVITIMLSFHGTDEQLYREYQAEMFKDTWECHEYIAEHKVELLTPHLIDYGDRLKGFEFYCESRYGEEV